MGPEIRPVACYSSRTQKHGNGREMEQERPVVDHGIQGSSNQAV